MSSDIVTVLLSISICSSLGCGNIVAVNNVPRASPTFSGVLPTPNSNKPPVPSELSNSSPAVLCDRLAEIKKLPYRDPNDTDPIYEALIAKGKDAYPCLVEKITDAKKMPDPREAPIWEYYAI